MAASRYWRLVGISTPGNGALELSEVRIYENGVLADTGATLTATVAPQSGTLADLRDGVATAESSWPYSTYSQPGFALVWDFGVGAGVEFPGLQLGAGSDANTFLLDATLQSSANGIAWLTYAPVLYAQYPGNKTLTPTPDSNPDTYYENVVLLLRGDGASGSAVFTDDSINGFTCTTVNFSISTAQKKFGAGSLYNTSSSAHVVTPQSDMLMMGVGDYTFEGMFYFEGFSASQSLFDTRAGGVGGGGQLLYVENSANISIYDTSSLNYIVGAHGLTARTWAHVCWTRSGSSVKVEINGVQIGATRSDTYNHVNRAVYIGGAAYTTSAIPLIGGMDDVRITKGVARTGVVLSPFGTGAVLASTTPRPARARFIAPTLKQMLPSSALPVTTAQGHLREYPFFDAYNGGIGVVYGTVKEKGTSANTPLRRRVLLIDEASRMTIRETWSDALTGNYEFRGVKEGVTYTVLSYDHTGAYRAVVADHQIPELIV